MTNKSAIICGGWKRKSILILKGTIVPFNAFGNISQIFIRFVPPFKSLPSFFPLYFPSFLLHPSLPSFFPSFLYLFIQNLHWLPYQCSLPTHQPTPNNHMIPQLTDYVLLGFRYSAKKTQNIPVSPPPPPTGNIVVESKVTGSAAVTTYHCILLELQDMSDQNLVNTEQLDCFFRRRMV